MSEGGKGAWPKTACAQARGVPGTGSLPPLPAPSCSGYLLNCLSREAVTLTKIRREGGKKGMQTLQTLWQEESSKAGPAITGPLPALKEDCVFIGTTLCPQHGESWERAAIPRMDAGS